MTAHLKKFPSTARQVATKAGDAVSKNPFKRHISYIAVFENATEAPFFWDYIPRDVHGLVWWSMQGLSIWAWFGLIYYKREIK